jgi:hypothetical protein
MMMLKMVLALGAILMVLTIGPADDIVINGHEMRKTVNCNGNNVVVDANDSVLTLRGKCNEVKVNGSTNSITIDEVASIVLESADNTVRWKKAAKGDKPSVTDRSTGNTVTQVK